ncbi:hypothetical protein [Neptunicella sp. SCSIO 80796]|uniref:hypothetical protein n=1 Tax=Neptunicella plasticusilytica TaxID=3117012 RepID=UPI003A4D505C
MLKTTIINLLLFCWASISCVQAQELSPPTADNDAPQSIEQQVQDLKKEVIALNRDLFILEEDLLFPSSTQLVVYVAMDMGSYFKLDAVELKIDDETVSQYLYTQRQVSALYRGGVQRLYIGNISQGDHQISAFFTGIGPQDRPYKRAVSGTFNKDSDAKALQLNIVDSSSKQQPEFTLTEL